MNKTGAATRATILRCLTDGMGVRAAARTAGVTKGTVLRLLVEAGEFAAFYSDFRIRGLRIPRIEMDERWSFISAKDRRATKPGQGSIWTFACLASDTKLVVSWLVGERSRECTDAFVADAASRTEGITQITTDGWAAYHDAISRHFTWRRADYAQVIKSFDATDDEEQRRYGPATCTGVTKLKVMGTPDMAKATTSYVENLNLQTRQRCRRLGRLTDAHSKKALNHMHAVALNFFAHNFMRVHGTLSKEQGKPTTPAMMHGLASRPWTADDWVAAIDPSAVTIK
jgi:IS1 family transposase